MKSNLSTVKKSNPTTFSRVFRPKKSTIFSGIQSWIFGQKMKISYSVYRKAFLNKGTADGCLFSRILLAASLRLVARSIHQLQSQWFWNEEKRGPPPPPLCVSRTLSASGIRGASVFAAPNDRAWDHRLGWEIKTGQLCLLPRISSGRPTFGRVPIWWLVFRRPSYLSHLQAHRL